MFCFIHYNSICIIISFTVIWVFLAQVFEHKGRIRIEDSESPLVL